MINYRTENLDDFGHREIQMLQEILAELIKTGLPKHFINYGVRPAFDTGTGIVYLVNTEFQAITLNHGKLEIYHHLPYSDQQGFLEDLIAECCPIYLNPDDARYIIQFAEMLDVELNDVWLRYKTSED